MSFACHRCRPPPGLARSRSTNEGNPIRVVLPRVSPILHRSRDGWSTTRSWAETVENARERRRSSQPKGRAVKTIGITTSERPFVVWGTETARAARLPQREIVVEGQAHGGACDELREGRRVTETHRPRTQRSRLSSSTRYSATKLEWA